MVENRSCGRMSTSASIGEQGSGFFVGDAAHGDFVRKELLRGARGGVARNGGSRRRPELITVSRADEREIEEERMGWSSAKCGRDEGHAVRHTGALVGFGCRRRWGVRSMRDRLREDRPGWRHIYIYTEKSSGPECLK
jgi:hypothetical protein